MSQVASSIASRHAGAQAQLAGEIAAEWELLDGGEEIRWEEIDEDVSVPNLLGVRAHFS